MVHHIDGCREPFHCVPSGKTRDDALVVQFDGCCKPCHCDPSGETRDEALVVPPFAIKWHPRALYSWHYCDPACSFKLDPISHIQCVLPDVATLRHVIPGMQVSFTLLQDTMHST